MDKYIWMPRTAIRIVEIPITQVMEIVVIYSHIKQCTIGLELPRKFLPIYKWWYKVANCYELFLLHWTMYTVYSKYWWLWDGIWFIFNVTVLSPPVLLTILKLESNSFTPTKVRPWAKRSHVPPNILDGLIELIEIYTDPTG